MSDEELVDPHFNVDGLPCKQNRCKGYDLITAGIGLPARNPKVQFVVKLRVNEHREQAVRRKKDELAFALAYMARSQGVHRTPSSAPAAGSAAPPPPAASVSDGDHGPPSDKEQAASGMDCFTQCMDVVSDGATDCETDREAAREEVCMDLFEPFESAAQPTPQPEESSAQRAGSDSTREMPEEFSFHRSQRPRIAARLAAEADLLRTKATLLKPSSAPPHASGRAGRAGAGSIDLFSQSKRDAAWSSYDSRRLGKRHTQTREFTYDQLLAERQEMAQQIKELNQELSDKVSACSPDSQERTAADHLQQAALELLDGEESEVRLQMSALPALGNSSRVVRFNWFLRVSQGTDDDPEDDGEPEQPSVVPRSEFVPTSCIKEVTHVLNGSPTVGTLALFPERGVLAWSKPFMAESYTAVALEAMQSVKLKSSRTNPFNPPSQSLVVMCQDSSCLTFYAAATNVAGEEMRGFASMLEATVQLARQAATATPNATATSHSNSDSTAPAPASATTAMPVKVTARVAAGRKLREELQKVVRLRSVGKVKEADAALAALDSTPTDADAKRKETSLAWRRVTELRNAAFSYGGLSLTKDVISRFIEIPEVREILPEAVQQRLANARAQEVRQVMMDTAKHFIASIYKTRGRRSDVDRNAMAAGLAELLPPTLFENRHGRAACRELGISYRQAKRGSQLNGQMLDWGNGWRQIKSAQHYDKVSYQPVIDFWHSPEASEIDNQNKEKIRVDLGLDPKSGERLYDFHPRRAQKASTKALLPVFRRSSYAAQLAERTKTRKRPNGVKCGRRQFAESKCPCVKKRKASECDCPECTYIDRNLSLVHAARPGWHRTKLQRIGGKLCDCHIHRWPSVAVGSVKMAEALKRIEEGWRMAAEEGDEEAAVKWEAACEAADAAYAEAVAATAKAAKARRYDEMTKNRKALTEALMAPCGKVSYPEYSIIGEGEFRAHKRRCIANNCEKKMWKGREACGWDRVFGEICPIENSNEPFSWFVWEKQLRGVNEEGKEFYSLEWIPKHGTRKEFWAEFRPKLATNLLHDWRDRMMSQGRRVLTDRRSGRHVELLERKRVAMAEASLPTLKRDALLILADRAKILASEELGSLSMLASHSWSALSEMLCVCSLAAARDAAPMAVGVTKASQAVDAARKIKDSLATTAVKQSDYAAQVETKREFTATCATRERHNCLVTLVGYRPYEERRKRSSRKRRPKKIMRYCSHELQPKGPLFDTNRPAYQPPPPPLPVESETVEYKQNVSVFFAFHKSGTKPSGRTYNIAQEDIDHILKYGSALHGEWFHNGERLPGGDHRKPLKAGSGLINAASFQAPFPEMWGTLNFSDGCPNQFHYGTNIHQAAQWQMKTAAWALKHAKARRELAKASLKAGAGALREAVGDDAKEAAATVLATLKEDAKKVDEETKVIVDSDGLTDAIVRTDVILIEHHGKGGCDAESNVIGFAIKEAILAGKMIDPSTHELVRFLAENKPTPSVEKVNKAGWEAPTDYYFGYFDTAKFTKRAVPDATSFKGVLEHHQFCGLSKDADKAERDGPLHVRKLFCACDACLLGRYDECTMGSEVGKMLRQPHGAPLAKGGALSCSQMVRLEEFADALDKGWLVAVDADASEHEEEGIYSGWHS